MDVGDYRKAYEQELRSARVAADRAIGPKRGQTEPTTAALLKVLQDPGAGDTERIAALEQLTPKARSQKRPIDTLIDLLADANDSPVVRLAVLGVLAELSFSVGTFQAHQPAYRDALRAAATDGNRKLRERVLEILALQNDEYAQRLIVDGLQDPTKALLSTRRAVQYLGYDVHAEHNDLLRDLVEQSDDKKVRHTALRLLSADGDAKDLFLRIVQDKDEDAEARTIGAVALQSLAPNEFASTAQGIVLDEDDDDDVRASVLTVLQHDDEHGLDATLGAALPQVPPRGWSKPLARASRDYITAVADAQPS